jgi:hypothetical protein
MGIRKEQFDPMSLAPIAAREFVATPKAPTDSVLIGDYLVTVNAQASGEYLIPGESVQIVMRSK